MKTKTACCILMAASLIAVFPGMNGHAGDDGDNEGDDNSQGGNIEGHEAIIAKVALVPTTNAPQGAQGCAKLKAENEDGVVTTHLRLALSGLDFGIYPLSVVRKSD